MYWIVHTAAFLHIFAGLGIRSFTHRSFPHFAQIKWATVSDSLRSLKTNERPWANPSGRSEEMSNREQIAQVAQDKWASLSNLLRLLRGNERMSVSLKKCWLNKSKILFLVFFIYDLKKFIEKWVNPSFPFYGEQCERFAHDRSFPLSDVSKSLRLFTSLRGNKRSWANHSGRS